MENQTSQSQENTTFNDQADQSFNKKLNEKEIKLSKGVTSDDDSSDDEGLRTQGAPAEEQVRQTEDASLQDDSYSFDEANTENEEYHDADDAEEIGLDNEDDTLH